MSRQKGRIFGSVFTTILILSLFVGFGLIIVAPVKGYLSIGGLNSPAGVAVDTSGNIYVADSANSLVKQFQPDGTPGWSSPVYQPYGIAVGVNAIYVTTTSQHQVTKIDPTTGEILWEYLLTPGLNFWPKGIAVHPLTGYLYIADAVNNWVGIWEAASTLDYHGNLGFGSLNGPSGVAIDATGNVYVADTNDNEIEMLAYDGTQHIWGGSGSGEGKFNSPMGVAVDNQGYLYVADTYNNRIQKFYNYVPANAIGVFNWAFGGQGNAQGEFYSPKGVYVDANHNFYVADSSNNRIQKFTQYTLTINKHDPSGVNYNYVYPYEGSAEYPEGSVVTLTAYATNGYAFIGWSGDVSGINNPTTITMNDPQPKTAKTVTANFALPFEAYYSPTAPTIDGALDLSTEWGDAGSYAISLNGYEGPSGVPVSPVSATVYLKHDGTRIYIGLEGFATGMGAGNEFSIYFDEGHDSPYGSGTRDGILMPSQEDCKSCFASDGIFSGLSDGYYGDGPGPWLGTGDHNRFAASCSFVTDHWEVEFSIPLVGVDGDSTGAYPDLSDLVCSIMDNIGMKIQHFTTMGDGVNFINYYYPAGDMYQAGTYNILSFESLSTGPGMTITSMVDDPSSITEPWRYAITYPDGHTELFILPADGGSTLLPITQTGQYKIEQTRKMEYATSATLDGVDFPAEEIANKISLTTTDYLNIGDTVSIVFNNELLKDIYFGKPAPTEGSSSQNSGSTYNMPSRVAVPVQVSWNPNIDANQELDLIKDKPVKIMVNLADLLTTSNPLNRILGTNEKVKIDLACAPNTGFFTSYSVDRPQSDIAAANIYIFSIPTPNNVGHYTITCTTTLVHVDGTTEPISTLDTLVKVRETSPLCLYYSHLSLANYGTEPHGSPGDAFDLMVGTSDFVKAVYPVPYVTVLSDTAGLAGQTRQDTPSQYYGIYLDCLLIEREAKAHFWDSPYVVGVAVGPDLRSGGGYTNYFKYNGAVSGNKVAVGVSFGRAVKGVVVSDGYYPAVAHEIAHTFGLYRGVPEQYTQYNPGALANGYWVEHNEWRSGYDFMGLSTYKSTATTWTSTTTTFNPLFAEFKTTADPQIILVSGAITKDNTLLDIPYDWMKLPYGVPDTVPTGDYAIKFTLIGGGTAEISFDAQFIMHLDPGIEMGEDLPNDFAGFGDVPISFAPFAFAAEYPANTDPTQVIEVVKKTQTGEQSIGAISPDRIETVSPGSLSAGFGGFVAPVKEGASFKKGTTVPVKFQLKTLEGTFITTAQPTLYLLSPGGQELPATSVPPVSGGNLFRYDYAKNQYVFNLYTSSLAPGKWQLRVYLGDGTPPKTVSIYIKTK